MQKKRITLGNQSLPLHFRTYFWYPSVGFRSTINLAQFLVAGVNFRVRYPLSPKCHVSNDPENESLKQNVGEREFK